MVSNLSYTAQEQSFVKTNPSKKIEKGLKRVLIIAGAIIAAQLVWLFGVSPFIPFSTIDVTVIDGLNRSQVLAIANVTETSSFMSTNVNEIRDRLLSNVLVESARVTKRFPDRLSIHLVPRQAVAVALGVINSRQQLLYIDRYGVFFKAAQPGHNTSGLPVISGIENPQINMQLPMALRPLMENIAALTVSSPELMSAISGIRIERKTWAGYDLVLYPVHSNIRVRVENNLTETGLKYMFVMLNVLENRYPRPSEIDIRAGVGSYIIKEPLL